MSHGRFLLTVFTLCLLAGTACEPADPPTRAVRTRASRFGVLRDLVLFRRTSAQGGSFFLDRFETTQADWLQYLKTCDEDGALRQRFDAWQRSLDPSLPVAGIDLSEARQYARWRFGRLPRLDEWRWAVTAGGKYRFPWGDRESGGRANAATLRLAGLTPVGAFESGRQSDRPYDLLGNVSEWTETIQIDWSADSPETESKRVPRLARWLANFDHCETIDDVLTELVLLVGRPAVRLRLELELSLEQGREGFLERGLVAVRQLFAPGLGPVTSDEALPPPPVSSAHEPNLTIAREALLRSPAFAVWHHRSLPLPLIWWLAADGFERFGYVCVGQMGQPIAAIDAETVDPQVSVCLPSERSFRRGVRVAAEPELLLSRLLAETSALDLESTDLLLTFLRQHREVLMRAARSLPEFKSTQSAVAELMRTEFSR